jgi:hypothetical protein
LGQKKAASKEQVRSKSREYEADIQNQQQSMLAHEGLKIWYGGDKSVNLSREVIGVKKQLIAEPLASLH